jgi:hypothetical protein
MQHSMHIQTVTAGTEGAFLPEQLVQLYGSAARKALTELPCPVCKVPIHVPDGLTLGEFLMRESAGKAGQYVSLQLKHIE